MRASPESPQGSYEPDGIDLRALACRVWRGLPMCCGLLLVGITAAVMLAVANQQISGRVVQTRVAFAMPKIEMDDPNIPQPAISAEEMKAPAVIAEALRRIGLSTSSTIQNEIRGSLQVEAIVPSSIAKAREKLRAAGQEPFAYVPDEYHVRFETSRRIPLDVNQRERLLVEIVSVFQDHVRHRFAERPLAFGTAFQTLETADFTEYELVLTNELDSIREYLRKKVREAPDFRSTSTNLSFQDLMEQAALFGETQLHEVLVLIRQHGLTRNRDLALLKVDHHLRLLEAQERRAVQEEQVVRNLLSKAQDRSQNYVLGIKKEAVETLSSATVIDRSLVDSLLEGDAYNLLVRRALISGRAVKAIQSHKARLSDLRASIQSFSEQQMAGRASLMNQVENSLVRLHGGYRELVRAIRETHNDYVRQQFAGAIRLTDEVRAPGMLKPIAQASAVGGLVGLVVGCGLSLLGIFIGGPVAPNLRKVSLDV